MTANDTLSGADRLSTMKRYRKLYFAAVAGAVIGFLALTRAGYPLVGVAVYWAGALAMLGIWQFAPVPLFDERERDLERRAVTLTMTLSALVLIFGGPALTVLEEVGYWETPAVARGVFWTLVAQALVFVVVLAGYRLTRR